MKSICVFRDDMGLGGAKNVAVNLSNELVKTFDLHFVTVKTPLKDFRQDLSDNVKAYVLLKENQRMRTAFFKAVFNLRKYIKQHNIKVVLCIGSMGTLLTSVSTAGLKSVKTIYCEHTNLKQLEHQPKIMKFYKWAGARFFDRIVTLTEPDAQHYSKKYRIAHKTSFIYNWISEEFHSKASYNTDSKNIISVGGFNKFKGFHNILPRVAEKIFAKYPDWQWHIYGDGELRKGIEHELKERGLENQVILRGISTSLEKVYPKYSFFVFTSIAEGFPLVLVEAKASGLPIVSFDIYTGPREIIEDNSNGFLIEPFDEESMAQRICELIEKPVLRSEFSKSAKTNLGKFSKEKIVEQWRYLIEQLS